MKQLVASEEPLVKIFSSDYDFVIPDYQRPYSWGDEQALQLIDDLVDALERAPDEPYFLGSIVLVKDKALASADVIDGQHCGIGTASSGKSAYWSTRSAIRA